MERDDDTKRQHKGVPCQSPLAALYQALAELLTECDQLDIAVQNQDPADAEIAAHDAVACLLDAKAALRRLHAHVDREDAVLALLATEAAQRWINDRFTRVAAHINSKSLHSALRLLRTKLSTTCGGGPAWRH